MSISTTQKPTTRRIVGMLVGIVIIGLGIASSSSPISATIPSAR